MAQKTISWIFNGRLFLILLCLALSRSMNALAQEPKNKADYAGVQKLLSQLDLNLPGLERVKDSVGNSEAAARELLIYYRARTSVKHPTPRPLPKDIPGKYANAKDIQIADDALKHILIGQSSYPSQFRGDDIDWATNPVPDKEWIVQLHRMPFWQCMAKTYLHTGDEKYAHEWAEQLQGWVRKNPYDKEHQYAWRSIEAGIRGHSWTALFQLFINSPSFTPETLTTFLGSCHTHAELLMKKYTQGSNWALMEAEGLAFIAVTFPEFKESGQWLAESVERFNKEIHNQVYSDGHQRELALGYHMGCIDWFMRTYKLLEMNGQQNLFSDSYLKTIENMCAAVIKVSFPDGSSPQFGDSWSGSAGGTYSKLRGWAKLFNREDLRYVGTGGKEGTEPKQTAFALQESGFYSMRSSWSRDAICMILKCGPNGGFHCQPDNGTFELYAGGRHLMPDSGCYIYSGDKENRNWFRATKNHQTLTLNEQNSLFAPKLLQWQPGPELDMLTVENAGYKGLTHRRTICFIDKKYFIIIDDAYGKATGDIDLNFQLAPGKAVFDSKNLTARSDFKDGWNVLLHAMNTKEVTMEEVEGQVSFKYTKKEPRPALRYRIIKESEAPVRFVTILLPYNGKQPSITCALTEQKEADKSTIELHLTHNGTEKKVTYSLPTIRD